MQLHFKPPGSVPFQQLSGRLIFGDTAAELDEFVLTRELVGATGPVEYHYEVTLDGHTTTVKAEAGRSVSFSQLPLRVRLLTRWMAQGMAQ